MKLNFDILMDYLPQSYKITSYGPKNQGLIYRRPLLYAQGQTMEPGRLYLTGISALPQVPSPGVAVICVGSSIPRQWRSGEASVLYIETSQSLVQVQQAVFAVYDRLEAWDDQLRDALEAYEQPSLNKMMVLGSELLCNDIGVFDSNLQQIYRCVYETREGQAPKITFQDSTQTITSKYWDCVNSVVRMESKLTAPYLTNAPGIKQDSYCCNLHYGGHYMGHIHLSARNRPFRPSDFPLADRMFVHLKKALFRYVSMTKRLSPPEITAILAILEDRPPENADEAVMELSAEECWICCRLVERRGGRSLPPDYMCGNLNAFLPGWVCVGRYQDSLVGLIRLNRQETQRNQALFQAFSSMCQRMGYLAGLSQEFHSLYEIRPYYIQASYTAARAVEDGAEGNLFLFRDYTLRYILQTSQSDMQQSCLIPPGLQRLLDHDREKGSEYIKTLNLYLRMECNASQTAERLYIHRSSFGKRMEKITSILDMDLDDPDVRLLLRICLRMMN